MIFLAFNQNLNMAQTPEQLAALKRIFGENYVPPTTEAPAAGDTGNKEPVVVPEGDNKDITVNTSDISSPAATPPAQIEMTDAQVLEYLRKKNLNIKSLDELAPPVDPSIEADKREAQKLSFAINNNIFTKKEYDSFITESKDPDSLVFRDYLHEALTEDPEISEDDVRAEFLEKYGLNSDPNSRRYKRGMKEIQMNADQILKEKYGKIYAADQSFNQHEQIQKQNQERQAKLLSQTPQYKNDVEQLVGNLKNYKVQFPNSEEFVVSLPEEYLGAIKQKFIDPAYVEQLVEKGYSKELLQETIELTAIKENLPSIIRAYHDEQMRAKQAGTRGIVHVHAGTKKEDASMLTDKQKQAQEFYKNRLKTDTVAN